MTGIATGIVIICVVVVALAVWPGLVARAARRPGGKNKGGQPMRGLVQGGKLRVSAAHRLANAVKPSPLLLRMPWLGRTCPDYLAGGGHPEVLKDICLPPGPGDELVQAPWVEPRVGVRQGPQGAPARGLSFHAEPKHFQFFQVAEG